jgi:hypothetical protein
LVDWRLDSLTGEHEDSMYLRLLHDAHIQ